MQWHKLAKEKNSALWNGFVDRFGFSPSINPDRWPNISVDIPVQRFDVRLHAATSEQFMERSREIDAHLWDLTERYGSSASSTTLFALEWQHVGFELDINVPPEPDSTRPIDLFPNGEYPLLMAENQDFYMFGDPWEKTISLFGRAVPESISLYLEATFSLKDLG